MTAQKCILLIPSVFSLVFCPFLQPSMAMPIPDRGSTLSLLGWVEGLPHQSYQEHQGQGPTAGSSHCRDAVSHQPRQFHPLTAPCLWIPFPGSPVSGQTGLWPETIVPMFCISWKANHSMEKLKITAQANTKPMLEQQRKTRGCLAVCKKLRCYEDCSPVLWKEKWLPLSLLAASCKWSSRLSLLTEWIHCHKHEPRAYPRTWWGCHAPWRWITALFQHRLYPAQPAFPLTHPSHAGNLVDVSACQQVW